MKRLMLFGAVVLTIAVSIVLLLARQPGQDASGEPMVSVTAPDLIGDEQLGEAAFEQYCARCHGALAAGREGIAPPLVHPIYRPGHHADGAFVLAARQGVRQHHWPFGSMPPVDAVSGQEVGHIVAYVRALQRANGID